ncbi:fungal specific transcription factor domain-containing protein [Colletotrichum graminicola M1.001]|uniref:Fungal specific transcription factor domain-containing protein n=1 Tax=Colletotrichum graminicola (strain M1.001 / M2 / FGSC 10212) TaxID=645133 RepID=E3QTZ8_COLGM|nr:fungal specific transcription factor domain-containing protein [Colletotrichum graminicola M1.001]EFQ34336.1 fungal specific transcription factor domain-containing protein [Colletotrichum graminicola M1.001]
MPGSSDATTRKRKRIPIACNSCRVRKSRCDGARPQCSTCVEQGLDCVYAANSGASNALVPKQYLEQVELRLADVEEEISRLKRLIPHSFSDEKQHATVSHRNSCRADDCSESAQAGESLNAENRSITGITPDTTDGVGTIEFTTDESWAYFGPSSNIAFMRIIRRTLDHLLRQTQRTQEGVTSSTPLQNTEQHVLAVSRSQSPIDDSFDPRKLETASEASRLPPEDEVIRLVRQYFGDAGILFPYIHEESFWKAFAYYRSIGMRNARHSWLALLNIIIAVAHSTTSSANIGLGDRQAISDVHYRRAKSLFMTEMMTGSNLESVQAMLLMSQYLQGSQRSVQTWSIHGLAVKAALELGFHSELALQRFEPLERETRIRTWYGCILLDRTLSMTFGRPPIIPQHMIRIPLPQHFISYPKVPSISRWSREEDSTLFWNASITLYGVTAAVIENLYESNVGSTSAVSVTHIVSSVIHIGQKLGDWQASLPLSMRLVEPSEVANPDAKPVQLKLRVVLTLRHHNLQILLHRPILDRCLQALDGGTKSTQEAATLEQAWHLSKTVCLRSAEATIRLVEACKLANDAQPTFSFLGAWWFTLYFTFNASLTIIALKLIEDSYASTPYNHSYAGTVAKLEETLKSAVSCIARIDTKNPTVEKCAKFTATLILTVQSLHMGRDDANVLSSSTTTITDENGVNQNTQILNNGGLDEAFSDLVNYLPQNFNDFSAASAPFAMSELMNDSSTGDLFW